MGHRPGQLPLDLAADPRPAAGRQTYDEDGRWRERRASVRSDLLDRAARAPPLRAAAPPVSTGREAFSAAYLDGVLAGVGEVGTQDLVATLTELTAVTVARALAAYDVTEVVASAAAPTTRRSWTRCGVGSATFRW